MSVKLTQGAIEVSMNITITELLLLNTSLELSVFSNVALLAAAVSTVS